MALGTSELSPLEQACGYAAFANAGMRPVKRTIRRIEDYQGNVLVSYEPELSRVMRESTGISMISMLRGVVTSGTGTRAQACGKPCGGKTGTTNSGRDVWFVGFTPDLSCAIWVGNDDNSPMPNGTGGGFCGPIWASFVRRASEALQCNGEFPEGTGAKESRRDESDNTDAFVTVCTETGMRATPGCPGTREVALKRGQRPPAFCTAHGGTTAAGAKSADEDGPVRVRVCASSGQLAGPNCPASRLRTFAPGQAPTSVCSVHGGSGGGHESGSGGRTGPDDSGPAPDKPGPASGGGKGDDTPASPVEPAGD
jgi:membrane peptidoglycan carboxypeptidase